MADASLLSVVLNKLIISSNLWAEGTGLYQMPVLFVPAL